MLRVIENLLRIALLNDLSEVHEYDMVGYSLSLTQRVSHHHNAIILLQLHKKILHRLASEDVYVSACRASQEAMRLQTKQPRLV